MNPEPREPSDTNPFSFEFKPTGAFPTDLNLETPALKPRVRSTHPPVKDWDRFELQGFLGQGGMGQVFMAWDLNLQRKVALKFLHGEVDGADEQMLREGRAQALIDHPHVVKIFEAGEHQGQSYLAMQYVPGSSLQEMAASLGLDERLRVLIQACYGVHAAHLRGLLHRDLKPSNILVEMREDGHCHAFVSDFGMARLDSAEETSAGVVLGTPAYMSPEQIRKDPVDARTDVYTLGGCLYWLLTNRPPYAAPTLRELMQQTLHQPPVVPRFWVLELSEDLEAIVLRALAKDPAQRYPTAKALAEDLGRYLEGRPVQAGPHRLSTHIRKWVRRNPVSAYLAGLALAILVLSAGAIVWTWQRAQQQSRYAIHFNEEAQDLIQTLMAMHNLPSDPGGTELARWQPRFALLRNEIAGARGLARAPAQVSLGQVYLVLEQWRRAKDAFEQAAKLGYAPPEARLGLGTALAGLYLQSGGALATLPPELAAKERARLQDSLAKPAQRLLTQARAFSETPDLVEARILASDERYPESLGKVEGVLARSPWLVEARHLQAQILVVAVQAGLSKLAPADLETLVGRALAALAQGRDLARNDPAFLVREAEIQGWLASQAHLRGNLTAPAVEAVLLPARKALAMDPGQTGALHAEANVWLLLGQQQANRQLDAREPYAQARAACLAALALEPAADWPAALLMRVESGLAAAVSLPSLGAEDPAPHVRLAEQYFADLARVAGPARADSASLGLAQALYLEANYAMDRGRDAQIPLEKALGLLERARAANRDWILPAIFHASLLVQRARLDADPSRWISQAAEELEGLHVLYPHNGYVTINLGNDNIRLATWKMGHPGMDPEGRLRITEALLKELPAYAPALEDRARQGLAAASSLRLDWKMGQGQDCRAEFAAFRKAILELRPDLRGEFFQELKFKEAKAALAAGTSPAVPLKALEATLHGPNAGDPGAQGFAGEIQLLNARWDLLSGQDPSRPLAQAEKIYTNLWRSPLWENRREAGAGLVKVHLLQACAGRPEPALAAARAMLLETRQAWPGFTELDLMEGVLLLRESATDQGQARIQAALQVNPSLASEAEAWKAILKR